MRFTVRRLFAVTAFVAMTAVTLTNAGVLSAALIVVSIGLFLAGSKAIERKRYGIAAAAIFVATACYWFGAVDRLSLLGGCHRCRSAEEVEQLRFFGVPFNRTERRFPSREALIANALGKPCPHDRFRLDDDVRWFGLIVREDIHATRAFIWRARLVDSRWYDESAHRKIVEFAERHPQVVDEFFLEVLCRSSSACLNQFVLDAGLVSIPAHEALAIAEEHARQKGVDLKTRQSRSATLTINGMDWIISYNRGRYPGDYFMIEVDGIDGSITVHGGE